MHESIIYADSSLSLLSYSLIRIITMPASRKRNKGKDRKAKQQAKKAENDRAEAHQFWRSFCSSIECDHGCVGISDDRLISTYDHPISCFWINFS